MCIIVGGGVDTSKTVVLAGRVKIGKNHKVSVLGYQNSLSTTPQGRRPQNALAIAPRGNRPASRDRRKTKAPAANGNCMLWPVPAVKRLTADNFVSLGENRTVLDDIAKAVTPVSRGLRRGVLGADSMKS